MHGNACGCVSVAVCQT
ncbi:Protein of unknown function [Gryllus bimaculatus]|nr:Protein of unknown function [Gryllus bimaculatus]